MCLYLYKIVEKNKQNSSERNQISCLEVGLGSREGRERKELQRGVKPFWRVIDMLIKCMSNIL